MREEDGSVKSGQVCILQISKYYEIHIIERRIFMFVRMNWINLNSELITINQFLQLL